MRWRSRKLRSARRLQDWRSMHAMRPLWSDLHDAPRFGPLQSDQLEVDVAIVGGGVTGLTAAWLLKKAGRRVAVLEARELLSGTTGGTTAHLTQVVDTRYHELASKFGKEGARLVAESNGAAITLIERLVAELGADCGFERVPGYLYAETADQLEELERELAAAVASGLSAVRDPKPPVPFKVKGAMRVDQQAQVDPRGYLLPLAQKVMSGGSFVFEQTRVRAVHDGATCTLETESGQLVRAAKVILATHSPLNQLLLQTKVAHSQSYVVSGPCGPRPSARRERPLPHRAAQDGLRVGRGEVARRGRSRRGEDRRGARQARGGLPGPRRPGARRPRHPAARPRGPRRRDRPQGGGGRGGEVGSFTRPHRP